MPVVIVYRSDTGLYHLTQVGLLPSNLSQSVFCPEAKVRDATRRNLSAMPATSTTMADQQTATAAKVV
jgi:hypothetical protein